MSRQPENIMSVLAQYQSLAEITRRMHSAALVNDWDTLCQIGTERDKLAARLPANLAGLSNTEQAAIRLLIEEILVSNSEISERATPWLEHTRTLLDSFGQAEATPPKA